MTMTMKTIESLRTEQITPEGMTEEGTEDGGRGRYRGAPRAITMRTREEERGDGDHWQG